MLQIAVVSSFLPLNSIQLDEQSTDYLSTLLLMDIVLAISNNAALNSILHVPVAGGKLMSHRIWVSSILVGNVNVDSKMVFILPWAVSEGSARPLGIVSLFNFCQASILVMAWICGLNLYFPDD